MAITKTAVWTTEDGRTFTEHYQAQAHDGVLGIQKFCKRYLSEFGDEVIAKILIDHVNELAPHAHAIMTAQPYDNDE